MHLRGLRRSRLLQQSEWHRWGEAGSGCSLLGAFPKELPFPDPCCSPQVMECCSSCGVLIFLPSCWQHKPLNLLKREIASCKGKEKINMVYALGQLCQCSVLCAQPLQEHSPKAHSLYNLTAGFPFGSSIQNLLGTAKVLGIPVRLFQSPFDLVHSGIVAQWWMEKGWRTRGKPCQGCSNWKWCYKSWLQHYCEACSAQSVSYKQSWC